MNTAENLAEAILLEQRGVFILTWVEKSELIRALCIFMAALGNLPWKDFFVPPGPDLPPALLRDLEVRQSDQEPSSEEPLLMLVLGETAGRTSGPALNGWRKALARRPGSLIVVAAGEEAEFVSASPDLSSYTTTHRGMADSFLSSWGQETAATLRDYLRDHQTIRLPESLSRLPGESLEPEELREWLRYHLGLEGSATQ